MKTSHQRRNILHLLAASLVSAVALSVSPVVRAEETVRVGYQKSSTLLILLKRSGELEKRLAALGYKVSWHELSSGLLSALNSGSVDIHADVADAFALFTQAAGAPLTYYAKENSAPSAQAIIVREDSPITSIADLKGKKVAVAKGSGSNFLLLSALQKVGLSIKDIDVRYLEAPDGRAAFLGKNVDAWAVWDPFLASTQQQEKVRVVADGNDDIARYYRFYMATTDFAEKHPKVLQIVFDALRETGKWVKANPQKAAQMLSPIWGNIDVSTVELTNSRRSYDIIPVNRAELAEQQRIADVYFQEKLIPRRINAQDIKIRSIQPKT